MSRVLVLLRVNQSTYDDIKARVAAAGQPDRFLRGDRISLDEVAIEVDPNEQEQALENWVSYQTMTSHGYEIEFDTNSNRYRHRKFDVTGERTFKWTPGWPKELR